MSRLMRSIGIQPPATPSDSEDDYPSTRRTKSSSRPRGYPSSRPSRPRQESALAKIPSPAPSVKDDEWDTDYDPRDKYYLTEPESDVDHRAPTSMAVQKYKPAKKEKSSKNSKDKSDDKSSRSRYLSPDDASTREDRRDTKSTSNSSRPRDDTGFNRRKSSMKPESISRSKETSKSTTRSYTSSTRPGLQRNPSSTVARSGPSNAGVRPSVARARSGNVKPRPAFARKVSAVLGGSSARSEPRPIKREKMSSMGYVALAAGVAELLKCATDGSPLIMKGMSAGTAALGAVAIDSLLKPKHEEGIRHEAMRSVAEVAIAHAVMTPILSRCSKTVRSNC